MRGRQLGAWVFGLLSFLFLVLVFVFAPESLPRYKQQVLAVISALLASCFGYFLTGSLRVRLRLTETPWGSLAAEGAGGFALGLLVLMWWWTPWAPVCCEKHSGLPHDWWTPS